MRTVLNTAPLIAEAAELATLADIVIANETEFELLVGREALTSEQREEMLLQMHKDTGQILIISSGPKVSWRLKAGACTGPRG